MAVSSDLLRLAMVRETTPGVTPATPAFMVARITSEGLNYNPTTSLSNELNPARQVSGVIVSGGSSGGDIGFELSRNGWFEEMLSAVLGNDWDATLAGRLEVGTILKTYSIEKRFTLDAVAPLYDFHRIIRAIVDSVQLTFTPGGPANGSATILGGTYSRDSAAIAGATYVDPGSHPVMVGSQAFPIRVRVDGVDYDAWCFTNITVNFRNNARAIECLGSVGAAEMVIGRFESEITAQIMLIDPVTAVMDAFLNNEEIGFGFIAGDGTTPENHYAFDFPRVRVQTAQQVAGGTNQDVILNVTMQALVTETGLAPTVDSCVTITRNPATPASADVGAGAGAAIPPVLDLPADFVLAETLMLDPLTAPAGLAQPQPQEAA